MLPELYCYASDLLASRIRYIHISLVHAGMAAVGLPAEYIMKSTRGDISGMHVFAEEPEFISTHFYTQNALLEFALQIYRRRDREAQREPKHAPKNTDMLLHFLQKNNTSS